LLNSELLKFGAVNLDNSVVIHLDGDFDSVLSLLQGQVTSDCSNVSDQFGQISSLCNEKGFVLCNFEIIFDKNKWLIIIEESSKDIFLDEINKFLPFYKVSSKLFDCQVTGVTRNKNEKLLSNEHIFLQSDEALLSLVISKDVQLDCNLKMSEWAFNRKFFGDHQINNEEKGKYRPHELGQHLTRVSFKKGCFKGQEIIARMEYLGKLKKETRLILYTDKEEVSQFTIIGKTYQDKEKYFSSCLGKIDSFS
tara:strand:+ start:649 stop:1401 length:753 start_codon:yes stop_codon:yes gene_type:complete